MDCIVQGWPARQASEDTLGNFKQQPYHLFNIMFLPYLYSSQTYSSNTAHCSRELASAFFCQHKKLLLVGESSRCSAALFQRSFGYYFYRHLALAACSSGAALWEPLVYSRCFQHCEHFYWKCLWKRTLRNVSWFAVHSAVNTVKLWKPVYICVHHLLVPMLSIA